MPHKDPESMKRKKGKDKLRERKNRNGKFTTKHVRNHTTQTNNNFQNKFDK